MLFWEKVMAVNQERIEQLEREAFAREDLLDSLIDYNKELSLEISTLKEQLAFWRDHQKNS